MPHVILLAQENAGGLIRAPGEGGAEATIINAVQWLERADILGKLLRSLALI